MSVDFGDENITRRRPSSREKSKGSFMKFLNRHGLSDEQAKKVLYGIAIGAFLLSLFFWF